MTSFTVFAQYFVEAPSGTNYSLKFVEYDATCFDPHHRIVGTAKQKVMM